MNRPLSELSDVYQKEIVRLQQIEQNLQEIEGTNVEVVRTKQLELIRS